MQSLTFLIRCLLSELRGGDESDEVAGCGEVIETTAGVGAARVVKCAARVERGCADVDQFLHNCA